MFDVGFWELALVGVIALLVVGPEKLPGLARTVGQWVGRAQRMTREFRRDLEREINMSEVRKLQQQLRAPELGKLAGDLNKEVNALNQSLNAPVASDGKPASGPAPAERPAAGGAAAPPERDGGA